MDQKLREKLVRMMHIEFVSDANKRIENLVSVYGISEDDAEDVVKEGLQDTIDSL